MPKAPKNISISDQARLNNFSHLFRIKIPHSKNVALFRPLKTFSNKKRIRNSELLDFLEKRCITQTKKNHSMSERLKRINLRNKCLKSGKTIKINNLNRWTRRWDPPLYIFVSYFIKKCLLKENKRIKKMNMCPISSICKVIWISPKQPEISKAVLC